MTLLDVTDLEASYGKTPILHGVSIRIKKGDIRAVIGRNGVGKTTLMRAIIGELLATSGEIIFDGTNVTESASDVRARLGMGYVPQNKNVFPRLTVRENLKMGKYINDKGTMELEDTIYGYFPVLEERQSQRAGTMSGGEQQMLAIARALIGDPKLLLLDEPSEGVQPSIVKDIRKKLIDINNDLGTTIMFVEQNMELTQNLAKSCYVMEKGEVIDELDAYEIKDSEIIEKYLAV